MLKEVLKVLLHGVLFIDGDSQPGPGSGTWHEQYGCNAEGSGRMASSDLAAQPPPARCQDPSILIPLPSPPCKLPQTSR